MEKGRERGVAVGADSAADARKGRRRFAAPGYCIARRRAFHTAGIRGGSKPQPRATARVPPFSRRVLRHLRPVTAVLTDFDPAPRSARLRGGGGALPGLLQWLAAPPRAHAVSDRKAIARSRTCTQHQAGPRETRRPPSRSVGRGPSRRPLCAPARAGGIARSRTRRSSCARGTDTPRGAREERRAEERRRGAKRSDGSHGRRTGAGTLATTDTQVSVPARCTGPGGFAALTSARVARPDLKALQEQDEGVTTKEERDQDPEIELRCRGWRSGCRTTFQDIR